MYEFYRGCVRKARYHSRKAANKAKTSMAERYTGFTFVSYRCEFCSQWHVGKSSQKEKT